MRVLIVDDEKPARERLRRMIDLIDDFELVAEADSGSQALKAYNEHKPEIVLLDIRMPMMDGLEVAQHLMIDDPPPAVIFTTAYSDHALEAFEAHAVDYLLKPVRKERLLKALQTAQRNTRAQIEAVNVSEKGANNQRRGICVRHRGNLMLIPVEDIVCFHASDKYVTLYHKNGEALTEESLVNLEQEFTPRFMRIHRNALVALEQMSGLNKQSDGSTLLILRDSTIQLEVSRRHLPAVRRQIKKLV